MLRDRALTTVDPYSFTQDVPWTNHEWLSELAMGIAFRHGGATGLLLLKAIVLGVAFVVMWRGLRDVAAPWRWGGLALVALAAECRQTGCHSVMSARLRRTVVPMNSHMCIP